MQKKYMIYTVSTEMPMLRDLIKPGCTLDAGKNIVRNNIKMFDSLEEAKAYLEDVSSSVYPRFECRKAYYEIHERRLDEVILDDAGKITESKNIGFADLDTSYLDDANDYMP